MASTARLLFGSSFPHVSHNSITTGSHTTRALWQKNRKLPKECFNNKIPMQHNWKHSYKYIDGGSTSDKSKTKFYINATSAQSNESEPQGYANGHAFVIAPGCGKFIRYISKVFCWLVEVYHTYRVRVFVCNDHKSVS
ncbi:hypothetical protein PIB30_064166 [Stylosanthes scabra]|uniref:Uncharacterized protein n=1 Tax=Stylosanthes scabra TaxID=79078 RepID=A0ABU6XJK3_9FABA|nr:hypothetical protein [Stylosanthes scabra]